jgi:hypothetical protein
MSLDQNPHTFAPVQLTKYITLEPADTSLTRTCPPHVLPQVLRGNLRPWQDTSVEEALNAHAVRRASDLIIAARR